MKTIFLILLTAAMANAQDKPDTPKEHAENEICFAANHLVSVAKKLEYEKRMEKISGVIKLSRKAELTESFERGLERMNEAFQDGIKQGVTTGMKHSLEHDCDGITKDDEKLLNEYFKKFRGDK